MGRTSSAGASRGLSGADPVSAVPKTMGLFGVWGGDVSPLRGRLNGGKQSSDIESRIESRLRGSGMSCGDADGDRGGERPIELETRRSADGEAITSPDGVGGRLRVAGEMRLSAAEGGSEKDAELLGERSPPPDPSEEAARECEVGAFKRAADSGWHFQR